MNSGNTDVISNRIPEICCAIVISFIANTDEKPIIIELNQIGIYNVKVCRPKYEPIISLKIAIIHNECFWNLNDALNKMFAQVDNCMIELNKIIHKHNGEVYIDIAFYQYGTYPELVFTRDIIKKVNFLDANISIDPY